MSASASATATAAAGTDAKATTAPSMPMLSAFLCADGMIRSLSDMKAPGMKTTQPAVISKAPLGLVFVGHVFDVPVEPRGTFQLLVFRDHCPALAWGGVFANSGDYFTKIMHLLAHDAFVCTVKDSFKTLSLEFEVMLKANGVVDVVSLDLKTVATGYAGSMYAVLGSLLQGRFIPSAVADVVSGSEMYKQKQASALTFWRLLRKQGVDEAGMSKEIERIREADRDAKRKGANKKKPKEGGPEEEAELMKKMAEMLKQDKK